MRQALLQRSRPQTGAFPKGQEYQRLVGSNTVAGGNFTVSEEKENVPVKPVP